MRVKGKIVGSLKKIDNEKSTLMIEIEFPTETDRVYSPRCFNPETKRMEFVEPKSESRVWHVPAELTIYFHEDYGDRVVDRITRRQLVDILERAVSDKKLKDTVLFRYQGGCKEFSDLELDVIEKYVRDSKEIELLQVRGRKRLLRPVNDIHTQSKN